MFPDIRAAVQQLKRRTKTMSGSRPPVQRVHGPGLIKSNCNGGLTGDEHSHPLSSTTAPKSFKARAV